MRQLVLIVPADLITGNSYHLVLFPVKLNFVTTSIGRGEAPKKKRNEKPPLKPIDKIGK